MSEAFLFLWLLGAFSAFALSMRRHQMDMFGTSPSPEWMLALRATGWLLLAGSLLYAMFDETERAVTLVLWFGIATAAALLVALGVTYLPRLFPGRR